MIHIRRVNGRWRYRRGVWAGWCRLGIHFMEWHLLEETWNCPCGYNMLRAEDAR